MKELSLYRNQLNGHIPNLSHLANLTLLHLGNNGLTGPVPDLRALTNLTTLYLAGNQLCVSERATLSHSNIAVASHLRSLSLRLQSCPATATPGLNTTATPTATQTPTATASTQTMATPTLTPAVTGKLPAPALTADAKGANAVELNWTEVDGAARYQLWVAITKDDQGSLAYVEPPATTYTHDGLIADATYYYWVRALSAAGEKGEWSERRHATVASMQSSSATPTATPTATATSTATATPTATAASNATATPTATATQVAPAPAEERAALVAFYNATGGANWTNNDNWLSPEPLSTWHGVFIDATGHVSELVLNDNGLNGSLPDLSAPHQSDETVPRLQPVERADSGS